MQTLRIILVVGFLAAAVAVGLAYVVAAFRGTTVTGDEIARNAILSFVIVSAAIVIGRRRSRR